MYVFCLTAVIIYGFTVNLRSISILLLKIISISHRWLRLLVYRKLVFELACYSFLPLNDVDCLFCLINAVDIFIIIIIIVLHFGLLFSQ